MFSPTSPFPPLVIRLCVFPWKKYVCPLNYGGNMKFLIGLFIALIVSLDILAFTVLYKSLIVLN
jgi:hypothetical protein